MFADLHAQARAIAAGKDSLQEALLRARELSLEAACAHAYTVHPADVLAAAARSASEVGFKGQSGAIGALAGLPVSVKDLFDVQDQATLAGSTALTGAAPATADCPAVARLRHAGGLIAGRTNMSEFAFSGVGINPHYGTPANPADRQVARITGGSSSGAAVSVATETAAPDEEPPVIRATWRSAGLAGVP